MAANKQEQQPNLLDTLNTLEDQLKQDIAPANNEATLQPVQPALQAEVNLGADPATEQSSAPSTEQVVDAQVEANMESSAVEQAVENYVETDDQNPDSSPYVIKKARPQDDTVKDDHAGKSSELIKVEELMAADLQDAFNAMTPEQQAKFKAKGEKTAQEIVTLMDKLKLTAKKALSLLRGWLKTIPGVNKYFLEQEAKIKTEEIMRYAEEQSHQKR